MSKYAFVTDTHLGCRGSSTIFREYFRWYYKEMFFPALKLEGVTTLFHGGDFFDNRNHVTLTDIDYVTEEFVPLLEEYGITLHIIPGNHDLAYKNTSKVSSLSILKTSEYVVVYEEPTLLDLDGMTLAMVPWINSENYESTDKWLRTLPNPQNTTILGHFEISGCKMYKNSVCDTGLEQSYFKDFKHVLSGHFHHPSKYGNIQYIGSAFHTTWQDYGDKRGYMVFDSENDEWVYHENVTCLFERVYYDELVHPELSDAELSDLCSHRYFELIVNESKDRSKLERLCDRIRSMSVHDFSIVDTTLFEVTYIDPEDAVETSSTDTLGMLNDRIDSVEQEIDTQSVKDRMKTLYNSALDEMYSGE